MIKKIIITGPESTGKSTLTKQLAESYNANWVKEYAREYLERLNGTYTFEDVIEMAKIQLQKEQESILQNELLFLDTDLTVFYVWIKEKYNKEIDWINEHLTQAQSKIYFLCDIDIPWQPDPLREHPNIEDRKRLFKMYKELLEKYQFHYYVISGNATTRLKKCKEILSY